MLVWESSIPILPVILHFSSNSICLNERIVCVTRHIFLMRCRPTFHNQKEFVFFFKSLYNLNTYSSLDGIWAVFSWVTAAQPSRQCAYGQEPESALAVSERLAAGESYGFLKSCTIVTRAALGIHGCATDMSVDGAAVWVSVYWKAISHIVWTGESYCTSPTVFLYRDQEVCYLSSASLCGKLVHLGLRGIGSDQWRSLQVPNSDWAHAACWPLLICFQGILRVFRSITEYLEPTRFYTFGCNFSNWWSYTGICVWGMRLQKHCAVVWGSTACSGLAACTSGARGLFGGSSIAV